MAQRVGIGIALLFHDRGIGTGWVVRSTPQPHFTPGKDPVPIVQEAGWAPGPVWMGAENLTPPGFNPRTVQPIAQSLYQLSYPAHLIIITSPKWMHQLKHFCFCFIQNGLKLSFCHIATENQTSLLSNRQHFWKIKKKNAVDNAYSLT
jgi:hypothetical protein